MKLSWLGIAVLLVGCGAGAPRPTATAPVSTAQLTSAEVGEANAPTPRVGKAQHAFGEDEGDAKRPERQPRKGGVFGDWK
jgi:hypothetical protein